MNNKLEKNRSISAQTALMQEILQVRYTDIEQEKNLCKQLLEVSEAEQYFYGSAFANVYLVDSHLALGQYNSCDFYLLRASALCKEYGFDDLMLVLCNCGGLYYQKRNDDQTALTYFLQGIALAEALGDISMAGKLNNNIGYSFARNGDLATARTYFQLAYETIAPYLEGENIRSAVSYLSNLAEACRFFGDAEGSRQALERCEALGEDNIYTRIRLACSWCSYYVDVADFEKCRSIVDRLIAEDLCAVQEQFFICDMVEGLCGNMLVIGDKSRTKQLLEIMQKVEYHTAVSVQYRILCLKIQYWEKYQETEKLAQAYQDYYEIVTKIGKIEAETCVEYMISKIQIYRATQEQAVMQRQVLALENASQLDALTGLYNRRYFNKLVSKITHRQDITTLGFLMLDVDYFKQYNDHYGHFKGDGALRAVARVLAKYTEQNIYASRYGGDEFVCLCVNQSDEQVLAYAQQVLNALKAENIPHQKHASAEMLTISVGYCNEAFAQNGDADSLLDLADQALYAVKNSARGGCMRKVLAKK